MEYARLGRSNMRVSKLALGTMNFGVRTDARPLSNLVRAIAEAHGATSAQVALAWTMRKPFVVPIPGTRKLHRLQENAGSMDLVLTQDELQALEECLDRLGY